MFDLSLYIHIPFCQKKCNYCDFLSFDNLAHDIDPYVDVLTREIENHRQYLSNYNIKTIFIGGGTPSILNPVQIEKIVSIINNKFTLDSDVEITIECNPGTLNQDKLMIYKKLGINRISLGLQTTHSERLKQLGRIHTFEVFENNFNLLRKMGYDNINIDLMFGLPNQELEEWENTIEKVLQLNPEHIATYGLTIEEETPFYHQYQKKLWDLPEEDIERKMYWLTDQRMKEAGYEHYEISNYGKSGYHSKHNKVYWTLKEYIGIGLGAAGFFQNERIENTRNLGDYIKSAGNLNDIIMKRHPVTSNEFREEFMFLGLRLLNGISLSEYMKRFGESIDHQYEAVIKKLISETLLEKVEDTLKLTNRGIDISNYVLSHFLL